MRRRAKAQGRRDLTPTENEVRGRTQHQFHAWAAAVRASVEKIQALAEGIRDKDRALEELLRGPKLDPAAVETLILEIRARHTEIERIIDALPTLDEMGEASEAPFAARRSRRPRRDG